MNNLGYTEISEGDLSQIVLDGENYPTRELSDFEIKKINNFFNFKYYYFYTGTSGVKSYSSIYYKSSERGRNIEIFAYNDEWYYVQVYMHNKFTKPFLNKRVLCYKCDQFDGLINLLEKIYDI